MCVLLLIFFLILFFIFLLAPSKCPKHKVEPFLFRYYAHRGLYTKNQSIPENSEPAFNNAVKSGYGVELDIQLTADDQIVVFHDDDLKRACNCESRVDQLTFKELQTLSLFETNEKIPLFSDVLKILDGKVPAIVELKSGRKNRLLCELSYQMLQSYRGLYVIESFDPRIVKWFRENAPELIRGQLACSYGSTSKSTPKPLRFLSSRCLLNYLSRPHFIAYEVNKKPIIVKFCEKLGAISVCWTSHDPEDYRHSDMVIFEHYLPPICYELKK